MKKSHWNDQKSKVSRNNDDNESKVEFRKSYKRIRPDQKFFPIQHIILILFWYLVFHFIHQLNHQCATVISFVSFPHIWFWVDFVQLNDEINKWTPKRRSFDAISWAPDWEWTHCQKFYPKGDLPKTAPAILVLCQVPEPLSIGVLCIHCTTWCKNVETPKKEDLPEMILKETKI